MNIKKSFLEINRYSRPGLMLHKVRAIVWHWVANPGSSDTAVRNYFARLKLQEGKELDKYRYASTHFAVDENSITQMIPEEEVAYHVGAKEYTNLVKYCFGEKYLNTPSTPNFITLGIEICHLDWEGRMHKKTIKNLIELTTQLCLKYGLDPMTQILRHYDLTGKKCPLWFVDHPKDFIKAKNTVFKKVKDFRKKERGNL